MSYGYSIDLRERVLSYIEDGHTQKEASEVFKIPRQTIYNWLCLKTGTGYLGCAVQASVVLQNSMKKN